VTRARSTLVHWAGPQDQRTACGRWTMHEDGARILETDADADLVDCRSCLRARGAK
jgi:hypothetical protein